MYIDYETFEDFEENFSDKFYSPGWVCRIYGVSRQAVHNWIIRDVINAHRFEGPEGYYVIIKESEFSKIDKYRLGRK